jgi:hypothetical protein
MHAKVTVADDVVFVGSFNLSHSGEQNAENVLEIHDPALAERLAGFVDDADHLVGASVGGVPVVGRIDDVRSLDALLVVGIGRPDDYAARTGRRYSIEYAMIRDVNDQPWRADLLGELLAPRLAHVNLIPLNPTPGSRWDASAKPAEAEFLRRLRARGVAATVRDTRGRDIDGACGQLAASGR